VEIHELDEIFRIRDLEIRPLKLPRAVHQTLIVV
jgi:hypothetical protein